MTYHKYHGHNRNVDLLRLLSHDIVLTTYGTVAADFKRKGSLLHRTQWYRIVLDEGLAFDSIDVSTLFDYYQLT